MRLLDARTLQFRTFYEPKVPKYAILSHTWGPDEDEVTFQEMSMVSRANAKEVTDSEDSRLVKRKPGYYKIIACCRQALSDELQYAWVDTCCIDKSSSAELSEAINSMFRWYQNSTICYAYLADFNAVGSHRDLLSAFSKSRWFARGWTLQELMAPVHVAFFDVSWRFYGTKSERVLSVKYSKWPLTHAISNATGIGYDTLQLGDLSASSIATKMSWAAHRQTTRIEDIAYCLLGIFDVNMPLLYGEGYKAFARLQEEIMKSSVDTSLFAWKTPDSISEDLPQRRLLTSVGFLAPFPSCFAHASRVYSMDTMDSTIGPRFQLLRQFSLDQRGLRINVRLIRLARENAVVAWFGCFDGDERPLYVFVDQPKSWDHDYFIFANDGLDTGPTQLPRYTSEHQLIVRRLDRASPITHDELVSLVGGQAFMDQPESDSHNLTLHVGRQTYFPSAFGQPQLELRQIPNGWSAFSILNHKLVQPRLLLLGTDVTRTFFTTSFGLHTGRKTGPWLVILVKVTWSPSLNDYLQKIRLKELGDGLPQKAGDKLAAVYNSTSTVYNSTGTIPQDWETCNQDQSIFVSSSPEPTLNNVKVVAKIFSCTKEVGRRFIVKVWTAPREDADDSSQTKRNTKTRSGQRLKPLSRLFNTGGTTGAI